VIVAVVAVRVMQPAVDQVIVMIAVRDLRVAAAFVTAAALDRLAGVGVRRRDADRVLVVVPVVRVMQVPVVEEIDVALVLDFRVAAFLAVDMVVVIVNVMSHRNGPPSDWVGVWRHLDRQRPMQFLNDSLRPEACALLHRNYRDLAPKRNAEIVTKLPFFQDFQAKFIEMASIRPNDVLHPQLGV